MGIQATAFCLIEGEPEMKEYKPDRWMWKGRLKVPKEITKNGETFTVHDWLNGVAFGQVCETMRDAGKGDGYILAGELRMEKWKGRDGEERSSLSLSIKTAYRALQAQSAASASDRPDEDIPF